MNTQSAPISPTPTQVQTQEDQGPKKKTCTCLCSNFIKRLSKFFCNKRPSRSSHRITISRPRTQRVKIESATTIITAEKIEPFHNSQNSQSNPTLPTAHPVDYQPARIHTVLSFPSERNPDFPSDEGFSPRSGQ